jgi:hypothetical protein
MEKLEQWRKATAGPFDKLRAGSSTALRLAQDDKFLGSIGLIEASNNGEDGSYWASSSKASVVAAVWVRESNFAKVLSPRVMELRWVGEA